MLVKDFIAGGRFPKEFYDTLPLVCEDCGADMDINNTMTILKCSNPYCSCKASQRLLALLRDLGVKNFGESRCTQFMEYFGLTNPYAIFGWSPDEDGVIGNMSEEFCYNLYDQINSHRKMLLWEYVKFGNLPNLRDSARYIFNGYNDLDTFYDDLESQGGVSFIQDKLGIAKGLDSDEISVRALSIYESLIMYHEELEEYIDYVDIISPKAILNICISTAVGAGYSSKSDFVAQMNQKFSDVVHINFLSGVTKDCDYLIWSKQGSETNKVKKAKNYGIPILTGAEFEAQLRNNFS